MTQHNLYSSPDAMPDNSLTLNGIVEVLSQWHQDNASYDSDSLLQGELTETLKASLTDQLSACLDALGSFLPGDGDQRRLKSLGSWLWESFARLSPQIEARTQRLLPRSWASDHVDRRLVDDSRVLLAQAINRPVGSLGIDALQDPAEDVAALLVGLQLAERQGLACDVLDRYLRHSGDYHMARLLSFYLVLASLRAARMAVTRDTNEALTGELDDVPPSAWMVEHLGLARRCLSLAEQHTEFRFPPLIIGVGVSGSGKSRFTQTLVAGLGAVRLTSCSERQRMHAFEKENSPQAGSADSVVDKYSDEITRITYQRLADCTGWLLDGGFPVCIDSTSLSREQRRLLWQQAENRGLPVLLVSFEADEATLRRRLGKRAVRLGITEAESLALFDIQRQAFDPFDDEERRHLIRLDTTADNAAETLAALIQENVRFC